MPGTTVDRLPYLDCWIPGVENSFLTVVHIAQQVPYRRRYDGYESLRTAVFDANLRPESIPLPTYCESVDVLLPMGWALAMILAKGMLDAGQAVMAV